MSGLRVTLQDVEPTIPPGPIKPRGSVKSRWQLLFAGLYNTEQEHWLHARMHLLPLFRYDGVVLHRLLAPSSLLLRPGRSMMNGQGQGQDGVGNVGQDGARPQERMVMSNATGQGTQES